MLFDGWCEVFKNILKLYLISLLKYVEFRSIRYVFLLLFETIQFIGSIEFIFPNKRVTHTTTDIDRKAANLCEVKVKIDDYIVVIKKTINIIVKLH